MDKYYIERKSLFESCSKEITNYSLQLKGNKKIELDKKEITKLIIKYKEQFDDVIELNLNLPNEKLFQLLNEEKYMEFFFNFSKLEMLLIFLKCNEC